MGFVDAAVTSGGSDVRSSGALAQVKWRGGIVGRPELQNLVSARGHELSKRLFFFAASDYSQHAVEYAEVMSIALFIYEPDGTLIPKNRHAAVTAARTGTVQSAFGKQWRNWWALSSMSVPPASTRSGVSKPGVWARVIWPFLKVHWRILGAVFFTLAVPGWMGAVVNPDEAMGETRMGNAGFLAGAIVGAAIFWTLYFVDRDNKKRIPSPPDEGRRE
ncbi:hypothetical protein IM25_23845 (plasmid) [Rhodococcus sp. p52]|uniref:restriction endonuclease n=1 Tax=Rhodococcus sp. p52 TaxID=935199 RepID=UPI000689B59A|nr:restriction endonuclease [Rhodococcus sp. p52]AOD24701.1 hypothetical protein IM25_23395 [Rhodococcus sp. p52]AOD24772.1 hypothetical protein IM25_23845 [Rhodococcus sp. p52]